MSKKILLLILLGFLILPAVSLAQLHSYGGGFSFQGIINSVVSIMWIIFEAVVVVCFVMAGILFLTAQGAPEKLQSAKSAFIWGVVGVIVGIIAYSIINIVGGALGGGGGGAGGGSGWGIWGTFGNGGASGGGYYNQNGVNVQVQGSSY